MYGRCVHLQALESVSKGQRKLDLAQRLTGALSSENDRWAENVIQLRADMELLTGDVLLAASFIRYGRRMRRDGLSQEYAVKRLRALFVWDGHHQATHLNFLCPCLVPLAAMSGHSPRYSATSSWDRSFCRSCKKSSRYVTSAACHGTGISRRMCDVEEKYFSAHAALRVSFRLLLRITMSRPHDTLFHADTTMHAMCNVLGCCWRRRFSSNVCRPRPHQDSHH